jgi:hypothetical protein
MDPLRHPDLVEIGTGLRAVHDAVLAAEQAAAAVLQRRHRTLWDLLVEWEDGGVAVAIETALGPVRGRPTVGADHVLVADVAVPFEAIVSARRL